MGPRTNVEVIGEAFNLKNGEQDPNIKWNVVGGSSFKKDMYANIASYGFDIYECPTSFKGYPWCGPNALYGQLPYDEDPDSRERSELFKMTEDGHSINLSESCSSYLLIFLCIYYTT